MGETALAFEGLHKRYGGLTVLDGVDLAVPVGQRHAIIGPNGAGKTTLFHVATGLVRPNAGTVRLRGRDVTDVPPHRRARLGLGRSFQITNLFPRLSALDNLVSAHLSATGARCAFWRAVDRRSPARDAARATLDEIGLSGRADVAAGLLSYADQRALEIGMATACAREVLLLDEPTAGMSQAETRNAVALIARMSAGRTVLMVEHDMRVVFELAHRITVLVGGRIVASDTPDAIRRDPAVREAYLGTKDPA